jgi:hypothetical protein
MYKISVIIEYNKCISDCEDALKINKTYTKAMHRKSKAFVGLSKKYLT